MVATSNSSGDWKWSAQVASGYCLARRRAIWAACRLTLAVVAMSRPRKQGLILAPWGGFCQVRRPPWPAADGRRRVRGLRGLSRGCVAPVVTHKFMQFSVPKGRLIVAQHVSAGKKGKTERFSSQGRLRRYFQVSFQLSLRDKFGLFRVPGPSDESLGYYQRPLRGQPTRLVCNNEVLSPRLWRTTLAARRLAFSQMPAYNAFGRRGFCLVDRSTDKVFLKGRRTEGVAMSAFDELSLSREDFSGKVRLVPPAEPRAVPPRDAAAAHLRAPLPRFAGRRLGRRPADRHGGAYLGLGERTTKAGRLFIPWPASAG